MQRIGDNRHKIVSLSAPGAVRLTNEACTATSIHYVFDTYSIGHTLGTALVDRGVKTWFFITVDYNFGYDLERDTAEVVTAKGGEIIGHARHPLDAPDFSSYLARAQQSKAKSVGLANAGADMTNTITRRKARHDPRAADLRRDVSAHQRRRCARARDGAGIDAERELLLGSRRRDPRLVEALFRHVGKMPNSLQAGVYSSVTHYLKAVKSAGTDATDPVMAAMKAVPVDDFFAHDGKIRADGLMVHDTRLFQVKAPDEIEIPVGLFQAGRDDPGRPGLPAALPIEMPAGEEITLIAMWPRLRPSGRRPLRRAPPAAWITLPFGKSRGSARGTGEASPARPPRRAARHRHRPRRISGS